MSHRRSPPQRRRSRSLRKTSLRALRPERHGRPLPTAPLWCARGGPARARTAAPQHPPAGVPAGRRRGPRQRARANRLRRHPHRAARRQSLRVPWPHPPTAPTPTQSCARSHASPSARAPARRPRGCALPLPLARDVPAPPVQCRAMPHAFLDPRPAPQHVRASVLLLDHWRASPRSPRAQQSPESASRDEWPRGHRAPPPTPAPVPPPRRMPATHSRRCRTAAYPAGAATQRGGRPNQSRASPTLATRRVGQQTQRVHAAHHRAWSQARAQARRPPPIRSTVGHASSRATPRRPHATVRGRPATARPRAGARANCRARRSLPVAPSPPSRRDWHRGESGRNHDTARRQSAGGLATHGRQPWPRHRGQWRRASGVALNGSASHPGTAKSASQESGATRLRRPSSCRHVPIRARQATRRQP